MSRKPVPVLFMSVMLVFVLASAGVAYGLWTQTLQILGAVTTDGLNVEWVITSGEPICSLDPTDPTTVHVTIEDAVPGTVQTCNFRIVNSGNIPVTITSETVSEDPPGSWLLADGSAYIPTAPPNTNGGPIYVSYVNNQGSVLNPGDQVATSLDIAVEDTAQQNTTYNFKVEVVVSQ
ncbi:MAG TPA: hypothetical protein VE136_11735 [Anaerolineales bacterium]|jgi:hypothetical protein|nr:hypothetical protein [Anaerolineales bacterium]